jgi:hypothetical protein
LATNISKPYLKTPFWLIMSRLSKKELTQNCIVFEIYYKKSWTKGELSTAITKAIIDKPEKLIKTFDLVSINYLKKIITSGGYIVCDGTDDGYILWTRGITKYIDIPGKQNYDFISFELLNVLTKYLFNEETTTLIKKYDRWERVILGMIQYYGIIADRELHKLFCKTIDSNLEYEIFTNFLKTRDMLDLMLYQLIDEENNIVYYYCDEVSDPNEIINGVLNRSKIEYKMFTADQFYMAGRIETFEATPEVEKLKMYLVKKQHVTNADVEIMIYECLHMIINCEKTTTIIQFFMGKLKFNSIDEANDLIVFINELHNNTRMWILKGHTPNELFDSEQKHFKPLPKTEKVGRNELCPCGSGKKYKKCCDK